MDDCCCKILDPLVTEEIEATFTDKRLVFVITIDIDGNDTSLAPKEVKTHLLTQPIYTTKFIVNCLSFCCLLKCSETLSERSFSEIDSLLNKRQKFIIAFDTDGQYTIFKRYQDNNDVNEFSMDILSKCISFGAFSGSCCLFSRTADGQRGVPIVCYTLPPGYRCPPGFDQV